MPDNNTELKALAAIVVIILGLAGYRVFHPSTTFAADGTDPSWDAAAEYSHESGRPTVLLFSAGWCPACRSLHENVLSRGEVQAELFHYNVHSVDLTDPTPQAQAHAQKFGVHAIPLMIRFDAAGKETDRTNYLEPRQMVAWLKAGE